MRIGNASVRSVLFKIIVLSIVDVIAVQLAITLGTRISIVLGVGIAIFTFILNIVFLDDRLYPWRWISPALAGMFLLVVYPMAYSVTIAFTNRGTGHILTKQQALDQWSKEFFAAKDALAYKTYIFARPSEDPQPSDFRFWLVDPQGKTFIASPVEPGLHEVSSTDTSYGERNEKNVPKALGEFVLVPPQRYSQRLQKIVIEDPPYQIVLTKLLLLEQVFESQRQQHRYVYDPATNSLTNQENLKVYHEDGGYFVTGVGNDREALNPGFESNIGVGNILRVITDANVREPFWQIFVWTVIFASTTVVTQFGLGLFFALVLNGPGLPLRPLWRSILIIPYAVPFWLSVVTWRGLLNPSYGPANRIIQSVFGISPQWFSDPTLAKLIILFVNMYLGFSYFMLVSLGALQSIPSDMYEAALIDGANDWHQFRFITLPMILIAVGPLLIASFAFNFNNFTLIELINNGGPPMSASTVAGYTDILLSYTFRLAFAGARGADYGFAAAIGIFIFVIVATLTFINFRFTGALEEASQNV
jgi:ABC-type sugar transport system permease subunit